MSLLFFSWPGHNLTNYINPFKEPTFLWHVSSLHDKSEMKNLTFAQFSIWLFGFSLLSWRSSLYILVINSLSDVRLKFFFSFYMLLVYSIDCIFWCSKVFNFDVVQFILFWYQIHEILQKSVSWGCLSLFSPKSFMVLPLMFRFMIHFELIFLLGVR